ncbi:hypothetical protein BAUCODRAFT_138412 [Baudoinia panamericana UAMH 10762]|uniref:Exocyst complex component Sec8 n=1 Tax=Baudoinia panamericana (strain UAMH 10762) TaxID=717646 RepID=M2MK19_BAUPA|nr:uncharacterized protein BAUCODRAFT_138412 [Baudoinia panamericana UAMH 10762]EMC97031.1 hypothetical protein BAUCODRAFT_138412 [Baudoinia panamericana UAMH 10762]
MSYMRQPNGNGSVSYMNGANRNRLADERSRSRGPASAFGYDGTSRQESHIRVPARVDRHHAQRRSYGQSMEDSRSRSRGAPASARYGARGGEVEEILRYISQHWSFMASDGCIPVKVALQLMDPSSLGLADQYDQFQDVHQQLQNALKVIVNEHHQGFNSSIGTFHKIQAAIHASQQRVRTLRAGLLQAKESLGAPRPELRAFATSSQSYDRMLQVVNDIEELQTIPDRLDALISEKRFLGAVATLKDALALIRKPEMDDIGALSELRVYLSNQEHSLTDILIEELHSHLYLKSPYCEERWKAHSKRDGSDGAVVVDEDRAMHIFLDNYDGSQPMQEDATRNPEANTFYYVQLLTESLFNLGKLEVAVDAIEQRLPVELFRVVERSHGEVEQRHPSTMRSAAARNRQQMYGGVHKRLDAEQQDILNDLLITLYAKFEAIAEGHRVLHDVTAAMLTRDAAQPSDSETLNRSFRELWKLLQSEIRSLLHDHLTASGVDAGGQRSKNGALTANIFRPQPRDRTRKLFKLADTDSKCTDLTTEREDLEFILRSSVPGLVNTSQAQNARPDAENSTIRADMSATGHKLLVEPSVFNMSVLLPPSLAFLNRLKTIVPSHSGVVASTLTSFLDDFLINVFYPQLDETLVDLCSRSIDDSSAFLPDPQWQAHSQRPVFAGTVRFFEVVETVCVMLDALPHEQSFSALVVQQMRTYYDKCYNWSKGLLQRAVATQEGQGALKMRLSAELATSGDISALVIEMLKLSSSGDEREQKALAEREAALLIHMVKERSIEEVDLINDRKSLSSLCTLHVSMKWLAARCHNLRYISPRAIDMGSTNNTDTTPSSQTPHHHARRWTTPSHHLDPAPTNPYLPLDPNTATQFDAVILSFRELSTLILRTLHIDLRLHLLHGIAASMSSTYSLGQPYNDPDPAILDLSGSLSTYDTAISSALLPAQYGFLTAHVHALVNHTLIALVTFIPSLDDFGLDRLRLNVSVLQQSLKSLSPPSTSTPTSTTTSSSSSSSTSNLSKAADFYALAEAGCDNIVNKGRTGGGGLV